MKSIKYLLLLLTLLFLGSCCTNKDTCSILTFKNFELINFPSDEAGGEIKVSIYRGGSNFTQLMEEIDAIGEATSDSKVFTVNTRELPIQNDYLIEIKKTGDKYQLSNFSTEKVACGKCFMRASNQYGYRLNGYSVDNRVQDFDGKIRILK